MRRCEPHRDRFSGGLVTVVDDSHGIGAYGATGRGTEEHCATPADVVIGTFGKAFGVNGGFVASSREVDRGGAPEGRHLHLHQPLSVADCAAAIVAVDLLDSAEGRERLHPPPRAASTSSGTASSGLGWESIAGPHPVVPLLVRDTDRTRRLVRHFFDHGVLVVGLTFPVVPKGDETIRFQVNAAHTEADVAEALAALEAFPG